MSKPHAHGVARSAARAPSSFLPLKGGGIRWGSATDSDCQFAMPGIDETRSFVPLRIAVLTVSDTRALGDDKSGATLVERIAKAGHAVADRAIVTDDVEKIRARVKAWIADPAIDVVITTGGTGFTGRDITPEALEPLFEKRMDGFATLFLLVSREKIGTSAIQTRATAGLAGRLPRRLGRDSRAPARLPLPPVQLRRDHAAPRRAPAPCQGQGCHRLTCTRELCVPAVAKITQPDVFFDRREPSR